VLGFFRVVGFSFLLKAALVVSVYASYVLKGALQFYFIFL
jgi:hypothetical protein